MAERKSSGIAGKEFQNVFVLSLSFFFVFTAYMAIQNLQSSLNQHQNLGVISLCVLYGAIIFSGILAPTIIRFTGLKNACITAWVAHIIYIGSNFYSSFYTLLPASVLLGVASGSLWTAQSTYLATCAYSKSKSSNTSAYIALSRMNGMFFVFFQCTQITGNLISSLVLKQGTYNSTGNQTNQCGSNECPSAVGNSSVIARPEEHVVYILLGTFLACAVVGLVCTVFFLSPITTSTCISDMDCVSSVTSCISLLFRSELIALVPLFMFKAMEQAVLWTDFNKSYVSCSLGIRMVGFVMAAYGGSTALFTFVVSCLAKYVGRIVLMTLCAVVNGGILVFLYVWHPTSDSIMLIFIVAVVWGLSEGILEPQINALVALMFPDNQEPAFANMHTWKAIAFTLTFIFGTVLCVDVKVLIAMGLLVLAMLLYYGVEIHLKLRTRSLDIDEHLPEIEINTEPICIKKRTE